jgi:hypothetical protein
MPRQSEQNGDMFLPAGRQWQLLLIPAGPITHREWQVMGLPVGGNREALIRNGS